MKSRVPAHIAALAACIIALFGCARPESERKLAYPRADDAAYLRETSADRELDRLYTLLALAIVHADLQKDTGKNARGYNIAAVLVDPQRRLRCWARNAVRREGSGLHHAETRLILNFLHQAVEHKLDGWTIYTTLEPCAMCAGVMTLQSVERVVYAQSDPAFGRALERLQFDSSSYGGYPPYPRPVRSVPSDLEHRRLLEAAYREAGQPPMPEWLVSTEARRLFAQAERDLRTFRVKHRENLGRYTEALRVLDAARTEPVFPYRLGCAISSNK